MTNNPQNLSLFNVDSVPTLTAVAPINDESVVYYKDRSIDFSKPVRVYKNLNNGKMSIQQGGKVVAYADSVTLKDVSFKVNEGGRLRVIKERQKNVHAYAIGLIVSFTNLDAPIGQPVTYDPYKFGYFYLKQDANLSEVIPTAQQTLYLSTTGAILLN